MVEAVLGFHAQDVHQPDINLWSRMKGFRKADLENALLRFLADEPSVEQWKVETGGRASD
jgi:hypothetical protein